VVSCIVPVDGVSLDERELTAYLKERLASYKIPREILLFAEEDFALTGNEKAKVGEIRQLAARRLGVDQ
jgi:acyl-CoA synthetase (AMP-forming)/AMP-acid ligase II